MQQRGYSAPEIALKTGLSVEYVYGVARLIENGEQRLLRAVDSGNIPLSVAVEIAEADEPDVQFALSRAYERGLLRGRRLVAAKRLIEQRHRRGKGLGIHCAGERPRMSADALVKAFQDEALRKQSMIRRTQETRNQLLLITAALRRLARDEQFLSLLEDEDLASMPEAVAERLRDPGQEQ